MQPEQIIQRIRENLIGQYQLFDTPFGQRPLVYADYTASGRSLRWLEHLIQEQVLPYYANTHSESSLCGARTTALREQARSTIANALGCGPDDRVIFCGSGATAAINRLIDILGLRGKKVSAVNNDNRPVVLVGPYEHHSNELPWRESTAQVARIPLDGHGHIDERALQQALERYAHRPLLMGSFSAASNVTGLISNVPRITRLLKRAGALAFWDYAAAGPYLRINMNDPGAHIDAVFLSPHKFVGGPGTPGILALKANLTGERVPGMVGGGTVSWVSSHSHRYLEDIERREEGGTPAIVESIRAGLAIGLREAVGTDEIARRETTMLKRARARLGECPSIEVLGPEDGDRLSILSLRFRRGKHELHYGYVVALLNDLFGIQARGGCSCAAPYGHDLLAISEDRSRQLEKAIVRGCAALRPGWVRLSVNYFIDERECDYLTQALTLIGELGWRLLPAYHLDARSGRWLHRDHRPQPLPPLDPLSGTTAESKKTPQTPDFKALLEQAEYLLLEGASEEHRIAAQQEVSLAASDEALRWFTLSEDEENYHAAPHRVHTGTTAPLAAH